MIAFRLEFDVFCHCGLLLTNESYVAVADKKKPCVIIRPCKECIQEKQKEGKSNE